MKIQTKELTGAAFDWAVATCDGYSNLRVDAFSSVLVMDPPRVEYGAVSLSSLNYSTDWAQGGPIIDLELTKVFRNVGGTWSAMILKDVPISVEDRGTSLALTRRAQWNGAGPTALVAAMRCYVASKLGDVIEVPDDLA